MGATAFANSNRAPRYQLREKDNRNVRLSTQDNRRKVQTQMLNVSATGVALIMGTMQAPRVGELVAMQFQIPGSSQIACYGRIVRVAEYKNKAENRAPSQVVVGIKFVYLPRNYADLLTNSIDRARIGNPKVFSYAHSTPASTENYREMIKLSFSVIVSTVLIAAAFYFLSQYEKSLPKRKAGWAQNFVDTEPAKK